MFELWKAPGSRSGKFGFDFVTTSIWDPVAEQFGAFPLIFGTLVSSLVALVIAVPLSLGVAIYLTEFAPKRLRQPVAFLIELLAAIPSVVYGLWGIFVLIPAAPEDRLSRSSATCSASCRSSRVRSTARRCSRPGIILAIMVMPYIMSVSREVLLAVPDTQREASLALGATRWEAVITAVVPYARSGIIGAIILGLGRALGETMAVTMLIGNRHEIAASLFAPGYTMAAAIANEFSEAVGDMHLSALAYVAFLLFVVTVLVNAGARLLIWRVARGSARREQGACERGRVLRRGWCSNVMVGLMIAAVVVARAAARSSSWSTWWSRAPAASRSTSSPRCPPRPARAGGGVVHAIVGTLIIVGMASLIGLPVGIARGHLLRRVSRPAGSPGSRRFVADVLNGTPSIVVGVFAWAWIVATQKHFSALAGSAALAMLMIPMVLRTTEEMIKLVPQLAARGGAGARLPALAHQPRDRGAHHAAGHRHRQPAGGRPHRGRDGAAALHRARQPVPELQPQPADGGAAAHGVHLRHRAVRGVAPLRLGGGAGPHPGGLRAQPGRAARHPPEVRPQWLSLP